MTHAALPSRRLKAQILGAEAQLQQAQINLDYTEIRAPIDGKIGRTAVTAGNFVSPEHAARWRRSSARTRCMWSSRCRRAR